MEDAGLEADCDGTKRIAGLSGRQKRLSSEIAAAGRRVGREVACNGRTKVDG